MARRVFLHVGTPKSGTTYLQSIVYADREALRRQGMLLPGAQRDDQIWATLVVRQDPRLADRPPRARRAWHRLRHDCAAWDGDALVTHEYFGAATAEQAREAVASLAPAEVHVVLTAREPLGTLCAAWQEMLKYGWTVPLEDFSLTASDRPDDVWNWRSLDVAEVLSRWGGTVPAERVHVVTVPRAPRRPTELLARFAEALGLDCDGLDPAGAAPNPSMGLVEAEALRSVNARLGFLDSGPARSRWIRHYLAESHLVIGESERFWPSPARIEECRARGSAAAEAVAGSGAHVVGDPQDLLVAEELPARRTPAQVADGEVVAVLRRLAGTVLDDVRRGRQELARRRG